jgi:hypothetical protein
MADLKQWQEKFQQKMKDISFDDFVQIYGSWCPLMLYKRDGMITQYPDTNRSPHIVPPEQFHPHREDLLSYGRDYDPQKPFFEQLEILRQTVPVATLFAYGSRENSDYANCVINSKNSYLSMTVVNAEDVCYSVSIKDGSSRVFNSVMARDNCENIYQSIGIIQSYNVFYSKYCHNCTDIRFCSNCIGCTHCLFCDDMENASYCIQNKQYTEQEYKQKKKELLDANKHKFYATYIALSSKAKNLVSENVTGQLLIECSDVQDGYYSYKIQDGHNTFLVWGLEWDEHIYNMFVGWAPTSTHMYGSVLWWMYSENVYSCFMFDNCNNVWYSVYMADCSFCFGCVGLKNKQFCIFNKQYTKEDRFTTVEMILSWLEKDGLLWNFFPATMNPFYFNDTAAALLTNVDAVKIQSDWYLRRDEAIKADIPPSADVVKISELDDYEWFDTTWNRSINPDILQKIIIDEQCNYYRIVKMEYDFLVKYWLPLPRKHRLERMKENFRLG